MKASNRTIAASLGITTLSFLTLFTTSADAYMIQVIGGNGEESYQDHTFTRSELSGGASGRNGMAASSGNLATGELKASTTSRLPIYDENGQLVHSGWTSVASVDIGEQIHIWGNIFEPTTVELRAHVSGTLDLGLDPVGAAAAEFWFGVTGLQGGGSGDLAYRFDLGEVGDCFSGRLITCPPDVTLTGTSFALDLVIPFLVPVVDEGFAREFVIYANLLTQSWSSGVANFGHTASLSFALPSGLSFTSESGVFLTGAATSVPEPTTLALFAAGLASLGLLRRSRRQTDLPDMKPNEHGALWRLSLDQIGPSPRRR